jgi:beta-barrel assembly-enhancing protease
MEARFSDGKSATIRTLSVAPVAGGLMVSDPATGSQELWPASDLLIAERASLRLTRASAPDVRLTLSKADFDAVVAGTSHLQVKTEQAKAGKLIGVLTAAGLSLAAIIYFGIPAAAGPLARATPIAYEKQLGESVSAQLGLAFKPCRIARPDGKAALQASATAFGRTAGIDHPSVIDTPIVNALALPGGQVWVTRGLIDAADNGDQVAAVIAHEVAHVQHRDVMVSLYRALGFGLILDAVIGGGSGAGQQLIMLGTNLADMRHSRSVETRADATAMDILHDLGHSSRGLASFFTTLQAIEGGKDKFGGDWLELVSSHPDTSRRIAAAKAGERDGTPVYGAAEWQAIQAVCAD